MTKSRELSAGEYHSEFLKLLAGAKQEVFQLEMLEQYGSPFEREFIEQYKKEALDTKALREALVKHYGFAPKWKDKKVDFKRVHIVSFPITYFDRYRIEAYKLLDEMGESTYFIERQKFYQLPIPSGIEISNMIDVDGAVLLQRYDLDKKKKEVITTNGQLADPELREKYKRFEAALLGAATPLKEFIDDPRVKLKLALVNHHCKECGSNEALLIKEWWTRGDEGNISLFKCVDCGASARDW